MLTADRQLMAQDPPPSAGPPTDGGPEGLEKVNGSGLILQQLGDITKRLDAVDHRLDALAANMAARRSALTQDIDSARNWSLGLMLLALVGLLAKLLVPGA
jgi:hypothetical protein